MDENSFMTVEWLKVVNIRIPDNVLSWILLVIGGSILRFIFMRIRNYQEDATLARKHGCQRSAELSTRWPLGLDRIKQLWESNTEGRLLAFLSSVAHEYEGELSQFLLVGPRAYYVMRSESIETVMSTNFKDFGFGCRPAVFAPLLGNGIFTQEGTPWKHSRELIRKQFIRAQYQNLDSSLGEHVDNLIECIPKKGVVDLQPLFFSMTMDVATALLFGKSVYSLRANIGKDSDLRNKLFSENFTIAQDGLAKRFRLAPLHFLYNPPKFRKACKYVHEYVERYVKESRSLGKNAAMENGSANESWFMGQLAAESASETDLRDQLLSILFAGRDTTACCLSWVLRLLVRHKVVLERLRKEIVSVLGDAMCPTREQIRQMPFLAMVIKETLRLYPTVPLNNREAVRSTVLPTGGGPDGMSPVLVRKGEIVIFSQYVNARKPNFYGQDAATFRPERWDTDELSNIGWAYFPFHGGPRRCLGEDFALMEVSYTIVRLLQRFPVIKLPTGEVNEPVGTERQTLTLVLSSADGCSVEICE